VAANKRGKEYVENGKGKGNADPFAGEGKKTEKCDT